MFDSLLDQHEFLVLDGALATELEARGHDLSDPLWSARVLVEGPEVIGQLHADYLEAGADILTTASYQATFEGLAGRGLGPEEARRVFRDSVRLAVEARDDFPGEPGRAEPLVAASIGPYAAFLHDGSEYRGDYRLDEGELMAFHRERLACLADAGADLLACETIPCLAEVRALCGLLEEHPGVRAWISFSPRSPMQGWYI